MSIVVPPVWLLGAHATVATFVNAVCVALTGPDKQRWWPLVPPSADASRPPPGVFAVQLALQRCVLHDGLEVVKALAVFVLVAYGNDTDGGWARFNLVAGGTACGGGMNLLASFATRALIDGRARRWLRAVLAVHAPRVPRGVEIASFMERARAYFLSGNQTLSDVLLSAAVFTLYGLLAPLLGTHVAPAAHWALAAAALPAFAAVVARSVLSKIITWSPVAAFAVAAVTRIFVETTVLFFFLYPVAVSLLRYSGVSGLHAAVAGLELFSSSPINTLQLAARTPGAWTLVLGQLLL